MRNTKIAYVLVAIKNLWFWLGIWVLYYLRFTNYSGIGLIETLMISTATLFEIPTGAVADLLGKRLTLVLSFLIGAAGNFMMGFAPNLSILLLSVPILTLGGTLFSGTLEALVYDSLRVDGQLTKYKRVIANNTTIQFAAYALASVVGGFMYKISPGMPFWIIGYFYVAGALISLLLVEPPIDTEKFSWKNYLLQTKAGFSELFKTPTIKIQTLFLLSVAFFEFISDQMLSDIQVVSFGFSAAVLGILAAVFYTLSALGSQITPRLTKNLSANSSVIWTGILVGLTLILSPLLGIYIGTFLIAIRWILSAVFVNISQEIVNENTESKYRATTISTFNVIASLPYVALAFVIGKTIDATSPNSFSFILGITLFALLLIGSLVLTKKAKPSHTYSQS